MSAREILDVYLSFFEKRGHKKIENSSLVPQNDPSTLFTTAGMQSLIKYLLGELHPDGKRLVNVQNCFRAVDIDEIGDNRHTTFFRMLGNWSLGDYFKNEQIPWFWEFLTGELEIDPKRLYVSIFEGYKNIPRDEESAEIWRELFAKAGVNPKDRVFYCGVEDNWWSMSGAPDEMSDGEPGGPDTEVYFDLRPNEGEIKGTLDENIKSERLMEIGNSVFMTYKKTNGEFTDLPAKNVDFGGGIERLLAAVEDKSDVFETNLYLPIINSIVKTSSKTYKEYKKDMRIICDHLISSSFIIAAGILPSNKNQGYVLRRLIRRTYDAWQNLGGIDVENVVRVIISQYKDTDPLIEEKFAEVVSVIEEEFDKYKRSISEARKFVEKKYPSAVSGQAKGGEVKGTVTISSGDAFNLYTSLGLSPTQIKSLGYNFNEQEFAGRMKEHQTKSREARSGSARKKS